MKMCMASLMHSSELMIFHLMLYTKRKTIDIPLHYMMDMEIPLEMSIRFVGILYENDVEVLEMNTDKSKEYEDKWNKDLSKVKKYGKV